MNMMWNQNSIQTINPNETELGSYDRTNKRPKSLNPKLKPSIVPNIEDEFKQIQKINGISFGFGIVFLVIFFLLVINGKIVLSGPYLPIYLELFQQKLEFVIRYQALGLLPIAINVLIVSVRRQMTNSAINPINDNTDDFINRFNKPLQNSMEQFLMSTIIQMVMAANLKAEQVIIFCPFMAITFFIGRIEYLVTYPTYRSFGFALSFIPTLIAILFNSYGAIKFIFT